MAGVLDFDQARRDQGRGPATLRAFGRDHRIPSSPPVGFVLLASQLRQKYDDRDDYSQRDTQDLLAAAIGKSTFAALVDEGLTPDDVALVIDMVGNLWQQAAAEGQEGDETGEAQAPTPGAGSDT